MMSERLAGGHGLAMPCTPHVIPDGAIVPGKECELAVPHPSVQQTTMQEDKICALTGCIVGKPDARDINETGIGGKVGRARVHAVTDDPTHAGGRARGKAVSDSSVVWTKVVIADSGFHLGLPFSSLCASVLRKQTLTSGCKNSLANSPRFLWA